MLADHAGLIKESSFGNELLILRFQVRVHGHIDRRPGVFEDGLLGRGPVLGGDHVVL
jgi:hypothetical protein